MAMTPGLLARRRAELSSRPPFLPPPPPLTKENAMAIVNVSGIPPGNDELKSNIADEMVRHSQSLAEKDRRPVDTLVKLAKHICSTEAVEANTVNFLEREKLAQTADLDESEKEILTQSVKNAFVSGIATHLVEGFDVVNKDHFTYDENGNITGVNERNKTRNPKCDSFLRSRPWRPGAPDVGYGGKKKRRQTKKKIHKKRKTLRRTRH